MPTTIQINPEWATDETVEAIFGLPRTRLYELRRDGEIRYKRLPTRDGGNLRKRVLNNVASIRQWIESLPDDNESPPTEAGEMAANPTENQP